MSLSDIIAKVKEHPELWQSAHPFYRHRFVSAKTWKQIAAELRLDEIAIRKRWKHLKDQYRKEQKKVLSNAIPMSFWSHYNDLHFLSDDMLTTNLKNIAGEKAEASDVQSENSDSDDLPLKKPRKSLSATTMKSGTKASQAAGIQPQTKFSDAGKLSLILNRLQAMEEAAETSNDLTAENMASNSDHMFILSLLPIMKKLTDIQKLQFRGKMNDWLLEFVTHNEYSERLDYKAYIQTDVKNNHSSTE